MDDIYQEILDEYRQLTDENPNAAFRLMQMATAYKDTLAEQMTHWHKLETDYKHSAEAIKSRLSITHAPTKPTEGNRFAAKEKEYLDALQEYTTARQMYELLEIRYSIVKDVAYQAFTIWDNCNKQVNTK